MSKGANYFMRTAAVAFGCLLFVCMGSVMIIDNSPSMGSGSGAGGGNQTPATSNWDHATFSDTNLGVFHSTTNGTEDDKVCPTTNSVTHWFERRSGEMRYYFNNGGITSYLAIGP